MSGIVGVSKQRKSEVIRKAMEKIGHRGGCGTVVFELESTTQGQTWWDGQQMSRGTITRHGVVFDGAIYNWRMLSPRSVTPHNAIEDLYDRNGLEFVRDLDGPFALLIGCDEGFFVARDPLGIAPLYEGIYEGVRCYASEAKSLIGWASDVREFPPGHYDDPEKGRVCYHRVKAVDPMDISSEDAAADLRCALSDSVAKRLEMGGDIGSWLSGGLDSSAMAALARKGCPKLKTFAVGVYGAPDLAYARLAAACLKTEHHELVVDMDDILRVLPEVIYYLESFDAPLVRSSVVNYMVGSLASEYVSSAFSGEGGDELFAGYEYLKGLSTNDLPDELVDITNSLHNTALQRVDRCSAAHGLVVHTGFLDRGVVECALRIPVEYKLWRNGSAVEKWILRKAMYGILPDAILNRKKAKFWEGAGVSDLLFKHASKVISDAEFKRSCTLPDGSLLDTKEELFYYRIFKDHFGDLDDLSFVGRTKDTPVAV